VGCAAMLSESPLVQVVGGAPPPPPPNMPPSRGHDPAPRASIHRDLLLSSDARCPGPACSLRRLCVGGRTGYSAAYATRGGGVRTYWRLGWMDAWLLAGRNFSGGVAGTGGLWGCVRRRRSIGGALGRGGVGEAGPDGQHGCIRGLDAALL
jgi:hypothetical protein